MCGDPDPEGVGGLLFDALARPGCRWGGVSRVRQSRLRQAAALLAATAVGWGVPLMTAGSASAEGASTIATAGVLPLGSLVIGGGQPIDFYRVQLSAGDRIDIVYDMLSQPNCGYLYLFDPTVSDFNLAEAKAVSGVNVRPGQQSVTLTSSFNGLGTLAVAIGGPNSYQSSSYPPLQTPVSGCTVVTPFSLTATIEHLTQVSVDRVPSRLSGPRRRVRIGADVQSPAGTPAGMCMFERIAGPLPVRVAQAPVRNGMCAATVRPGRAGPVAFRVTFTGTGWQTATATSHSIIVS